MFKQNIGTQGRVFRLIAAVLLLLYAIWEKSWIALIVSLFIFFEALKGWCIIYQLLGKNSCPIDKK